MRDLTDPRAMLLKAILFAVIGLASATLLLLESPTVRTVALLLMMVWAFCRLYYFAFYVIERYIDPAYRFSGVWSAVVYLLRVRNRRAP